MAAGSIKWTDNQQQRLTKSVRAFNAKITREAKKNPELAEFLPSKMDIKTLRKTLLTAKDLNDVVRKSSNIFKADALKPVTTARGIMTTAYELKELSVGVRRINRERAKALAALGEYEPTVKTGTMPSIEANNLAPKPFDLEKITPRDWEDFKKSVETQMRDSYTALRKMRFQENYIKAIDSELGPAGSELISLIRSLTPDKFFAGVMGNSLLDIPYVYAPEAAEDRADNLVERWGEFIEEFSAGET